MLGSIALMQLMLLIVWHFHWWSN